MPYKDPEKQQQYYRDRQERRKTDPEYIAKRREALRSRWESDPEFRNRHLAYQSEYRKSRRATDSEYGQRDREAMKWRGRRSKIQYTPEQRAVFESLEACEICRRVTGKTLHMDHCHDCGHYRGGLCPRCNTHEGVLRLWGAICPEGSPMRIYLDRHVCTHVA